MDDTYIRFVDDVQPSHCNLSTAAHSQIQTTSASSSSPRFSPRHADSDSRLTPPENSFTQDKFDGTSTSVKTLSSTHSPPPLFDNELTSPGGGGSSEMSSNLDDRDGSDQDVESVSGMSKDWFSAGKKGVVISAGEEVKKKTLTKKRSEMHCCDVCLKKFHRYGLFSTIASPKDLEKKKILKLSFSLFYRPSGLRTHMNTHSNEKREPYSKNNTFN